MAINLQIKVYKEYTAPLGKGRYRVLHCFYVDDWGGQAKAEKALPFGKCCFYKTLLEAI